MKPPYDDGIFNRELEIGRAHEVIVGEALLANKIKCTFRTEALDEEDASLTYEQRRKKYRNEKDIILPSGDIIEVKSRNLDFDDDPDNFPYPTVFVETVSSWKGHDPTPLAVVHISQITGDMLVTMGYDEPNWTIEKKYDRVRSIHDTWYMADRNHLETFDFLVGYIKGNATQKK
jgi:hypothetical protein